MNPAMIPTGTRVATQGEHYMEGTVIGPSPDFDNWIVVVWDNGETFDEWPGDVTPIKPRGSSDDLV